MKKRESMVDVNQQHENKGGESARLNFREWANTIEPKC